MEMCASLVADSRASHDRISSGSEELNDILSLINCIKSEHEKTTVVSLHKSLDELHTKRLLAQQLSEEMNKSRTESLEIRKQIDEINSQPVDDGMYAKQRDTFNKYCGLVFQVMDDNTVMLTFSNIDSIISDRKFSIRLSTTTSAAGNPQWALIAADPEIEEISQLVSQLKSDNNFHSFCKQLRKLYQKK